VKYIILLIIIAGQLSVMAQKKELYYDYTWNPCKPLDARFYSIVEKTDSGWLRKDYFLGTMTLQMQNLYEDSSCKISNGYYKYYYANSYPSSIGRMVHNKREGVCVSYYYNGMMADSGTYHNGIPSGSHLMWHRNGYTSDSIAHVNDSMDVHIGWFDDGSIEFAGYQLLEKKYGKWKYYHRNGNISSEELYKQGKLISANYYNEENLLLSDTAKANTPALFKNGEKESWRNYLEENVYWPDGYQFNNGNMAVVVVEFTINEEGKTEDVEVAIPFHPEFDKIAVDIIRRSPAWQPAIAHNRKVRSRFRQPVTFQQQD
jgi:TonB family protein